MDEQEHRDFLLETAEKVSTWIIDEVIMKRFKEQAKAFYDEVVKYEGKEQTPDPVDRLVLPYATHLDAHIGKITDDDYLKHKSIPFDEEKSLQADYVLLTIIHDKRLKNPRTPPISDGIWSKDEEWVELKYRKLVNRYNCGSRDIQTQVKLTLKRVKADIDKLPAETEQDTTPAKRRGIRAWLRRHPHSYGLTGGVIFLILFFVLGLFKSQWRQWCWGVAGLAFLVLVLSLLGGRSR